MKIASEIASTLKNTAKRLKGVDKRQFMAEAVNSLGVGAQRAAERQMNWCRNTIAKGQHELRTGVTCVNNHSTQGRKKAEELNPELIGHIRAIVEDQAQADPSMNSERLYLKITAPNVRKQLESMFGYTKDMLPSVSTVSRKLNANGYHLKKIRKTLPLKKFLKLI